MNYQFDSGEAELYGLPEAVLVFYFRFWILKNKANSKHFYEGRTWTYNKLEAFTELFPFWTKNQVERIVNSLVSQEVILKGNFNATAYDRTCWYAFVDEAKSLKSDFHFGENRNGSRQNQTPIPVSTTVTSTVLSTGGEGQSLALGLDTEVIPPPTKKSRKTNLKKLFKDSQFKDLKYTVEYFQGTDLAQVNWKHYLPKIEAWSDKKSVKRDEQGWRDTIETWITKDINTNSLRTVRDIHPDNGTIENPKTLKGEAYFDYYGGLNPNFKQPDQ